MREHLRAIWKRLMHRELRYQDRHRRLDELYRLSDPWEMDTDRERFRFEETNRLIHSAFGRVGRILEIGCGEGHQSQHLQQICDRLTGIDVSRRAIARARRRVPAAEFEADALETSALARGKAPFDLVVAAEVLYYIGDVPRCLRIMESLGNACFVSYYTGCGGDLESILLARGITTMAEFTSGSTTWRARWWSAGTG